MKNQVVEPLKIFIPMILYLITLSMIYFLVRVTILRFQIQKIGELLEEDELIIKYYELYLEDKILR